MRAVIGVDVSPDGRTVAFARWRSALESDVYLVPAAGGPPRRIATVTSPVRGLAWAADGRALLTAREERGQVKLQRVDDFIYSGATAESVLFNFPDASVITAYNYGFFGTVLAPTLATMVWPASSAGPAPGRVSSSPGSSSASGAGRTPRSSAR